MLLSFGGAGDTSDFSNMAANWPTFSTALVALVKSLGLDGIDIDIEGGMGSNMDILVKLVNFTVAQGWILTGAPCCGDNPDWATLLKRTALPGKCAFNWLNLQTYGSGAGAASMYTSWEKNLVRRGGAMSSLPRPHYLSID